MSWLEVRIALHDREPARYEAALLALGAISIEYRDGADQPILEPGPGELPLWRDLRLVALLPDGTKAETVRQLIRAAARPDTPPQIETGRLHDRNWLAEWRASLEPRRFGERLWVCPHGHPPPDKDASTVWLDPGLAFGTGSHPTTALCLDWIANHVDGGSLLDYGCGSGILGLAALALGADRVVAIDNDPQARDACRANLARNPPQRNMLVAAPDELDPGSRFGYIVANILSGTLIDIAPRLASHGRNGTRIALTGILPEQAESVREAYSPWFAELAMHKREGWVLLSGTSIAQE
jgi:ribosomal protein L11 methyltransferase